MPKVSVVMPVYNGEAYLKDAIQSIINQSFTDWEFIIVNEFGSNERATAILRDFEAQDARIRIIQNQTRLRIAESLNVGLREATGTYIARMDADDIAGEERIAIQVEFLDSHPEIDICGLKVDMFGENAWDWKVYQDPEYLKCATLFYTPFVHPTIMMRSSSLKREKLEYNADFFYTEDYEFFERASDKLRYTNLNYPGCYRYRYVSTNATNVGGNEGVRLQNQVMKRGFSRWGLEFTNDQIRYLSPNSYPHAMDAEKAQDDLNILDLLLKEVFLCDSLRNVFGIDLLFQVLHRRWMDAYESYRWQPEVMKDGQVERAIKRGLFYNEHFFLYDAAEMPYSVDLPKISVVIPTYNSENYIIDTLYSLLKQDFSDIEILVVNEATTNDRTVKCIGLFKDPRIRIIQNESRLGLANSLNEGIRQAKGEYIARADADDVYPIDRFSKQVKYLDEHPEISVCGSWQRHFGKRNYIHKPPVTKEKMRASLLFGCEVCHSTVMMRLKDIQSLDKLYDPNYLSEDYELWSRASQTLNFATIPEVLGEYRWNGENITAKKMELLDIEAQKIVRRNLKQSLGIDVSDEDLILLSGWKNPFMQEDEQQASLQQREAKLLEEIESTNQKKQFFDQKALEQVVDRRRVWAGIKKESFFVEYREAEQRVGISSMLKQLLKKIFKPIYGPIRRRFENRLISIQESVWRQDGIGSETLQAVYNADGHLYDYFDALESKIEQQNATLERIGNILEQIVVLLHTRDEELNQICGKIEQNVCMQIAEAEKHFNQVIDERILKAEQNINQTTDERIRKAEQSINQTTDGRIWKAEQSINQTTDGRIWKAEQSINQTTDGRIWKMENNMRAGFQNMYLADCVKEIGEVGTMSATYDDIFYFENRAGSVMSARTVFSKLLSRMGCNSIVDFGCGSGTWLWVAKHFGVQNILGIDGAYVPSKQLMIPQECFRAEDLEKEVALTERYDLAISMEVAEHLHENSADTFVKSICKAADVVLFSAAQPGQGGDGHINEQPVEYWEEKFKKQGYHPIIIKQLFANEPNLESWYRENIILFANDDKYEEVKGLFI